MTKVARAVSEKSEQLDFTKKYSKDTVTKKFYQVNFLIYFQSIFYCNISSYSLYWSTCLSSNRIGILQIGPQFRSFGRSIRHFTHDGFLCPKITTIFLVSGISHFLGPKTKSDPVTQYGIFYGFGSILQ